MKQRLLMFTGILATLMLLVFTSIAEEPFGNGVIVAGNTWASYRPPHIPGAFPGRNPYVDDFQTRSNSNAANGNWIFWQSRYVSSGRFGNSVFSWPFGRFIAGPWGEPLAASVFDPSPEFAAANKKNYAADPLEPLELQYSYLRYGTHLPGAGDPSRDYVIPGGKSGGGAYFADERKELAIYEAGWPTNVGIDVKLKVYSLTTPWGNLDDNQLVEVEFYNTGEADMDNDGTVDLSNHRIEGLAMQYHGEPWFMSMTPSGTRWYSVGGYRAAYHDATPDETGSPWTYSGYAFGAINRELENDPGIMTRQGNNTGFYNDLVYGFTFVGALSIDDGGNVAGEKNLMWKDSNGNEVVHATGVGARRGWFQSNHSTESQIGGTNGPPRGDFINAIAEFFTDAGKSRSVDLVDLTANPAMFELGTGEDVTSWKIKDDPNTWAYPDGALEKVPPVTEYNGIQLPGPNPIPSFGGTANRPLHADLIHEGVVTENNFGKEAQAGFGPFALDVGERMRVYFVRSLGFRPTQVRGAIKAARAMYEGIKATGSLVDPGAPAVPEIRVTASTNVKPLVMFNTVADADGYKVYRSKAWPPFDPTQDGLMYESVYWKTMQEGEDNRPTPDPNNPMLTNFERIREKPGEHWGPYALIKHIPASELENFINPRKQDARAYPYAYEDSEDAFTLPGQTFYYYVSAYKKMRAAPPYNKLEGDEVTWIESGKVNVNGRDGYWKDSWPFTPRDPFFPDATDIEGLKAIGAEFVLLSPPVEESDLELGRAQIVVRPNPYKRLAFHDVGAEHKILFANLPVQATITIIDLSGQIIDRIQFEAPTPDNGTYFWDMFSKDGIEVASGVYIWVVEYDGGMQKGVFSILK